jgi:hypothetical protein
MRAPAKEEAQSIHGGSNPAKPPCSKPAIAVNSNSIYGHELGPNESLATTGYVNTAGSTNTQSNSSSTFAASVISDGAWP